MSLHWFSPPKASSENLATYLEHLHPLGVRWWDRWVGGAPAVTYQVDGTQLLAEIGCLTVVPASGLIKIWPYAEIGDAEARCLARCAQNAFEEQLSARNGWSFNRRPKGQNFWSTAILVEIHEEGLRSLVGRNELRMITEQSQVKALSFKTSASIEVAAP